jgi:GNAT superfamily N-acetyltransferase
MPQIHPLQNTPLPTVVAAFTTAFADYLVQLPSDVNYWEQRFTAARVDWALSFGVFEDEQLVAFIIQGIDDFQGQRTAFNTGTGVLPSRRGRALVDALYAHALPIMPAAGVTCCALEVITQNARAIRVYERIGFQHARRVCCFKGELRTQQADVQVREVSRETLFAAQLPGRDRDSWDNTDQAIAAGGAGYQCFEARQGAKVLGYFVANLKSGYVPRLELLIDPSPERWDLLLAGLAQVCPTPRLNNLDARRTDMLEALLRNGLANVIDQFELVMQIDQP